MLKFKDIKIGNFIIYKNEDYYDSCLILKKTRISNECCFFKVFSIKRNKIEEWGFSPDNIKNTHKLC